MIAALRSAGQPLAAPASKVSRGSDTARDLSAMEYDSLLEGLQSGRLGGRPVSGPGPAALIGILRHRGWQVNYREIAAAVPHFPEQFDRDEICGVLDHLGYATFRSRLSGRALDTLPTGSFICLPKGTFALLERQGDSDLVLRDVVTCKITVPGRNQVYDCVGVFEKDTREPEEPREAAWLDNVWRRFRPEIRLILCLTFMSNALVIAASLSVRFIFDTVLPAQALDSLAALMVGLAGLLVLDLRLRHIKSRLVGRVSGRMEYIISSALYAKLVTLPLEMLTATSVSDQINRLKQFETIRDTFCGPIVAVLFELPFVLILTIAVFVISPVIGLLAAGIVLLNIAIGLVLYPGIRHASRQTAARRNGYMRLVEETLGQRSQIVRRHLGGLWIERIAGEHRRMASAQQRLDMIWRLLSNLSAVMTPLALGAVILVGAGQAISGNLSGGGLIAATILTARLMAPVQQALLVAIRAPEIGALVRQVNAMMNLASVGTRSGHLHEHRIEPRIVFENVVLRFPNSVAPALLGINLEIPSGSFVAVGGPSGSGKSSLLRAAMGHYRAQSGAVYVGPFNINQLVGQERAVQIGYLGHQPLQIHGTIAQNLRLSLPQASLARMKAVCAEIGILDTIISLPEGFDTRLSFKTKTMFTAAFRTKLSIAQLLLKEPGILLFDEPDSGLTPEDEALLIAAIKRRAGKVTCLLVTQRPSLMRQADRVILLDQGKVRFYESPDKLTF